MSIPARFLGVVLAWRPRRRNQPSAAFSTSRSSSAPRHRARSLAASGFNVASAARALVKRGVAAGLVNHAVGIALIHRIILLLAAGRRDGMAALGAWRGRGEWPV